MMRITAKSLLLLLALLPLSQHARAACHPANAPASSMGCMSVLSGGPAGNDFLLFWRDSAFPAANQTATVAALSGYYDTLSHTWTATSNTFGTVGTNTLQVTPGASASTPVVLAATGTAGGITHQITGLGTITFQTGAGGNRAYSGSQNTPFVNFVVNPTGSTTAGSFQLIKVGASDQINANNALNGVSLFSIGDTLTSSARGGRNALLTTITLDQAITGDTSKQQYVSASSAAEASANVGGSGGTSFKGFLYGHGSQAVLSSGATNWAVVNGGGEDDLGVASGASVRDEILHSFVLITGHAVAGSRANYGLFIGSQLGAAATLQNAFVVGGPGGPWPVNANVVNSTQGIITTDPQINCGNFDKSCLFPPQISPGGINLKYVNFSIPSGKSIDLPGFGVDGTGQTVMAGGLRAITTGSGYALDVPSAQQVQSVAVATPGTAAGDGLNSYWPGDIVYGTGTLGIGQYEITHTQLIAAGIVAAGTGGTPNATCTVVGTTGTGTKAIVNVTLDANGAISTVNSIPTPGDYTVNPTGAGETSGVINAEPVANSAGCGSITGATLNFGMGALAPIVVLVPDVFAACPGSITPSYGSGDGLVLTPTCAARSTVQLNPTGAGVQIGAASETLAAGEVGMTKIAASGSAPGAAGGKFALVCGTNAGTAKLIVYAGTSTTPSTVVDNIGGGVTGC